MDGFIILGNHSAITYKEIFPYLKNNKMWLGYKPLGGEMYFHITDEYKEEIVKTKKEGTGWVEIDGEVMARVTQACWFTNLEHSKRKAFIGLTRKYSPTDYPKYDNYDAIEVGRVEDIPKDYDGVMGVPISFLGKYNPNQFEILDARDYTDDERLKKKSTYLIKDADGSINGKPTYARILIRKVKELPTEKEVKPLMDCLIIGPATALGYHTLFTLFADKVIKVGHKGHKERIGFMFNTEQGDKFQTAYWYTTLKVKDFDRKFTLTKTYDPKKYPHYDNYPDIIEVRRCDDIPIDYTGIMGVPTSFFRYHPELDYEVLELNDKCRIDGKQMFKRLFIRRKKWGLKEEKRYFI